MGVGDVFMLAHFCWLFVVVTLILLLLLITHDGECSVRMNEYTATVMSVARLVESFVGVGWLGGLLVGWLVEQVGVSCGLFTEQTNAARVQGVEQG